MKCLYDTTLCDRDRYLLQDEGIVTCRGVCFTCLLLFEIISCTVLSSDVAAQTSWICSSGEQETQQPSILPNAAWPHKPGKQLHHLTNLPGITMYEGQNLMRIKFVPLWMDSSSFWKGGALCSPELLSFLTSCTSQSQRHLTNSHCLLFLQWLMSYPFPLPSFIRCQALFIWYHWVLALILDSFPGLLDQFFTQGLNISRRMICQVAPLGQELPVDAILNHTLKKHFPLSKSLVTILLRHVWLSSHLPYVETPFGLGQCKASQTSSKPSPCPYTLSYSIGLVSKSACEVGQVSEIVNCHRLLNAHKLTSFPSSCPDFTRWSVTLFRRFVRISVAGHWRGGGRCDATERYHLSEAKRREPMKWQTTHQMCKTTYWPVSGCSVSSSGFWSTYKTELVVISHDPDTQSIWCANRTHVQATERRNRRIVWRYLQKQSSPTAVSWWSILLKVRVTKSWGLTSEKAHENSLSVLTAS